MNHAVSSQDQAALLAALRLNVLALLGVQESNSRWYLEHFTNYCQHKSKVYRVRACLLSVCEREREIHISDFVVFLLSKHLLQVSNGLLSHEISNSTFK